MAIDTLNAAQKNAVKQELIKAGHGKAAAKIFKQPKSRKPKKTHSKEQINFTLIFGGGLILTLLGLYFGIEYGFIRINGG